MNDTKAYLIIADGSVKLRVVATTKWQALDKAFNEYTQYNHFNYCNLVRQRKQNSVARHKAD
jgi:hypothetical protein